MKVRIIGLDVGDKRIGVSVSDELGLTAQPLKVVDRRGLRADLEAIAGLVEAYEAGKVVIGLPRNMNGSLGPRAAKAEEFASALGKATAAEIVMWDERLSTVAAERTLIEADLSRAKRKKVVDKVAAAIILQGYLDRQAWGSGAQ